jgi:hypothetical protein
MKIKAFKEHFSTLFIKINKGRHYRLWTPVIFLFRRFLAGMMLNLPKVGAWWGLLQFFCVVTNGHVNLVYLWVTMPYNTKGLNRWIMATEAVYTLCVTQTLLFQPFETSLQMKMYGTWIAVVCQFALILMNVMHVFYLLWLGPEQYRLIISHELVIREIDDQLEEMNRAFRRKYQKGFIEKILAPLNAEGAGSGDFLQRWAKLTQEASLRDGKAGKAHNSDSDSSDSDGKAAPEADNEKPKKSSKKKKLDDDLADDLFDDSAKPKKKSKGKSSKRNKNLNDNDMLMGSSVSSAMTSSM